MFADEVEHYRKLHDVYGDKCLNGMHSELVCNNCGTDVEIPHHCRERSCPICSYSQYLRLIKKYHKVNEDLVNPFFVTLTIKNREDLRQGTSDIRKYFKRLCRRKPYNSIFAGGFYGIETTIGRDGLWNIHMHVLIDSAYDLGHLPWLYNRRNTKDTRFSKDWLDITGDSFIVDWQRTRYPKRAVSYVLKYLTAENKLYRIKEKRGEFDRALKGQRLIQFFGCLYNFKGLNFHMVCKSCGAVGMFEFLGVIDTYGHFHPPGGATFAG